MEQVMSIFWLNCLKPQAKTELEFHLDYGVDFGTLV